MRHTSRPRHHTPQNTLAPTGKTGSAMHAPSTPADPFRSPWTTTPWTRAPRQAAVMAICLVLGMFLIASPPRPARAEPLPDPAAVERSLLPGTLPPGARVEDAAMSLTERMRRYRVPGAAVAFFHDGRVTWARGYGVTHTGGPDVTPSTRFQAASISKFVASLCAVHAAARNAPPLDAPARDFLRRWAPPPYPAESATVFVTLRMLLSHTGGVNVPGFPGYPAAVPSPPWPRSCGESRPPRRPPCASLCRRARLSGTPVAASSWRNSLSRTSPGSRWSASPNESSSPLAA